MQAFTDWFLAPGKRAAYDERRLEYINRHRRAVIIIWNSGQVEETGKEAFNRRKKDILKRKYEMPVDMGWDTTAEPPTKKRKTADTTAEPPTKKRKIADSASYQPAQPVPPTQGSLSVGSHSPSKKQRETNASNGRVFGLTASGKPCLNCVKGGYFCSQHEQQRTNSTSSQKFPSSFLGFAGSAPGSSNPNSQQFPGCVPDPSNPFSQQSPGSIPGFATHTKYNNCTINVHNVHNNPSHHSNANHYF
jgi:hypothetical protein